MAPTGEIHPVGAFFVWRNHKLNQRGRIRCTRKSRGAGRACDPEEQNAPAGQNDGGLDEKYLNMSLSISASGSASLALAGLNDVTNQMNDAQQKISTGKAVNGYADNPSVFYTATMMNRQVDAFKSSAMDINNSQNNINNALGAAKSVATSLQSIKTALTDMTKAGLSALQRQNDAANIKKA
jgi:hypothetical protein